MTERKRYVSWEAEKERGRKPGRNKRVKEHILLLIARKEEYVSGCRKRRRVERERNETENKRNKKR